ncbi:MAG: hypothetical protein ACRDSL_16330, partial [Pseudonocardiaceae bacterium]
MTWAAANSGRCGAGQLIERRVERGRVGFADQVQHRAQWFETPGDAQVGQRRPVPGTPGRQFLPRFDAGPVPAFGRL